MTRARKTTVTTPKKKRKTIKRRRKRREIRLLRALKKTYPWLLQRPLVMEIALRLLPLRLVTIQTKRTRSPRKRGQRGSQTGTQVPLPRDKQTRIPLKKSRLNIFSNKLDQIRVLNRYLFKSNQQLRKLVYQADSHQP